MKKNVEPTSALARFTAGLEIRQIETRVRDRVKLLLLDSLASALTGWSSNETEIVAASARSLFGQGQTTVIGDEAASPAAATLINGYLITARSLCDVHRPTLCHVTPVVVPPILAVAADREVDGEALLVALAAGMEAIVRIGLGLDFPEFRSRGWHTPGVAGPLGAALGVARLMKLDNEWSARAMGIAAEHASGTFAVFGTPSIKFNQARAAMAGLLSAEMARRRFGAPDDILTAADGGLLATFAGGGKPDLITNGLGSRWELTEITTRLWPAAAALQSVIAMLLDPNSPPVEHIESVTVGLSSANFEMHAGIGWETPFHAQLSTRYVTSVAIHDRRCWLDQFRPERLTDSEVVDFASRRVKVIEDPALGDGGATLRFDTRDGEIRSYRREVPKGHPLEPATWEETAAKLASAVSGRRTRGSADEIVEMVASLENLSNSRRLAELLSSG